jgi:glycosyltransferase involved in cell wall biosynthesis
MGPDDGRAGGADGRAPTVSVIIPAYNCERYVREAIESVLAQTYTDYEVIVVNDAATDGTAALLSEYEKAGKVRVVTHERNRGLAATRNTGIRHSRGRFVTFLDADDVWRPEKLQYHMSILEQHPEVMLVSNNGLRFADGEAVEFPPLPEVPELRPVSWRRLVMGSCPLSGSNATVRRECLDEVGLFDEELRAAEDRDLWMRIARRFGVMEASGFLHGYRQHRASLTANPAHMKRNMKAVLRKAFREVACPLSLRARAYARMYLDVAVTCYDTARRMQALENLGKSLLVWPLPLGRNGRSVPFLRCIWAVKMVLGRKLFEALWRRVRGGAAGRGRTG